MLVTGATLPCSPAGLSPRRPCWSSCQRMRHHVHRQLSLLELWIHWSQWLAAIGGITELSNLLRGVRKIALRAQRTMPSLRKAAEFCFVESACCAQLFFTVSICAIRAVAHACLDQFLAQLGASEVWQRTELNLVVCEWALLAFGTHPKHCELAHLCFGELPGPRRFARGVNDSLHANKITAAVRCRSHMSAPA